MSILQGERYLACRFRLSETSSVLISFPGKEQDEDATSFVRWLHFGRKYVCGAKNNLFSQILFSGAAFLAFCFFGASQARSDSSNPINITGGYGDVVHIESSGFYLIDAIYPDFRYTHVTEINGSRVYYSKERFAHTEDGKLYFIARRIYEERQNWIEIPDAFKYPVTFIALENDLSKEEIVSYFSNGVISGYLRRNNTIAFVGYNIKPAESIAWHLTIDSVESKFGASLNEISIILDPFVQRLNDPIYSHEFFQYALISTNEREFFLKFSNSAWIAEDITVREGVSTSDSKIKILTLKEYWHFGRYVSLFIPGKKCTYPIGNFKRNEIVELDLSSFFSRSSSEVKVLHGDDGYSYFIKNNIMRRTFQDPKFFECDSRYSIFSDRKNFEYYEINSASSVRSYCKSESTKDTLQVFRRYKDAGGYEGAPAGLYLTCQEDKFLHLFDVLSSDGSDNTLEDDDNIFSLRNKDVIAPCYPEEKCPSSERRRIKIIYIGSFFVGG